MKNFPTIKNMMTPNPISVNAEDNVSKVIEKIKENNFDHLPVVGKWNNLIGIISKTDLYKKVLDLTQSTTGKAYTNKMLFVSRAKEIMTPNPIIVTTDHSIEYAIELLLQGDFHALPVLDDDERLVGIITSKDILEFIIDERTIPV